MLFHAALKEVLTDELHSVLTEPYHVWLRDAFEPFLETRQNIVTEAIAYLTKSDEKITVGTTNDRVPPNPPCVLIHPSQAFDLEEFIGDSPEDTIPQPGVAMRRTHYRANLSGHEIIVITTNPDFTQYLWLLVMLLLGQSSVKNRLARMGYDSLKIRGNPQQRNPSNTVEVAQVITASAAFEASVADRGTTTMVNEIKSTVYSLPEQTAKAAAAALFTLGPPVP